MYLLTTPPTYPPHQSPPRTQSPSTRLITIKSAERDRSQIAFNLMVCKPNGLGGSDVIHKKKCNWICERTLKSECLLLDSYAVHKNKILCNGRIFSWFQWLQICSPFSRGNASDPRLLQKWPNGQEWTGKVYQRRQEEHQVERWGCRGPRGQQVSFAGLVL